MTDSSVSGIGGWAWGMPGSWGTPSWSSRECTLACLTQLLPLLFRTFLQQPGFVWSPRASVPNHSWDGERERDKARPATSACFLMLCEVWGSQVPLSVCDDLSYGKVLNALGFTICYTGPFHSRLRLGGVPRLPRQRHLAQQHLQLLPELPSSPYRWRMLICGVPELSSGAIRSTFTQDPPSLVAAFLPGRL